jgi:hypothetical protein
MNKPEPLSDIEAYLRRVVAPDAAAVERVLARVFATPTHRQRRPGLRAWAAVGVTTVLLATTTVWRWRETGPPRADDSPLTITGDGGLVVVERTTDGRRWAIIPSPDGAPVGNYVIVMKK